MKKVVQINTVVNTGSTGTIAEKIGDLAISHGWESYIAHGRKSNSSSSKLLKIGNQFDQIFHVILTRVFDLHCFASTKATKNLINTLNRIKPSIIHLHNLHGYYINIELLFQYISDQDIPIVWTLHDCWAFTGHCAYYTSIDCNKWESECNNCPVKTGYPKSIVYDGSRRNYKAKKRLFNLPQKMVITSVSNWLNDQVRKSFLSQKELQTIYNGVNLNVFRYRSDEALIEKFDLRNKYVILGVANPWSVRKGLNDFVNLSKRLGKDQIVVLIGLSKKQIRDLPKNIIGLEKTNNREELANWYSISDLYLNFSVEETFGLTTAESMACGTPVIVYDSTASPELVNRKVGRIVEKYDDNGILSSIQEIRNLGKKHFHKACIEHAQTLFNENKNYQKYIDLYNSILEKYKTK